MGNKLLEGVKVVELANFVAGPAAGKFFVDAGADVYRIEAANGDPLRFTAVSEGRPFNLEENPTMELENGGKKDISIDTRTPEGMEILHKLLSNADIFFTNWRNKALVKSGLDYDTLKQKYPKLVYGIITGYGEGGPDDNLPGFDYTAFFSRGGYLETLRPKSGLPFNVVPGAGDHNVAMNLVAGMLAALYHAKVTGKGERVETSLFETAVFNLSMSHQSAQYHEPGTFLPMDPRTAPNPLLNCYRTKDNRYIMMCFPNYDTYYAKFMDVLGHPEMIGNERFSPVNNMTKNNTGGEVYDLVQSEFEKKTAEEWLPILNAADLPCALCKNGLEILNDEQAWGNGTLVEFTYPSGQKRTLIRQPIRYREMGLPEALRAPQVGENSREVLAELGYTKEEIKELEEKNIIYVYDRATFKSLV